MIALLIVITAVVVTFSSFVLFCLICSKPKFKEYSVKDDPIIIEIQKMESSHPPLM